MVAVEGAVLPGGGGSPGRLAPPPVFHGVEKIARGWKTQRRGACGRGRGRGRRGNATEDRQMDEMAHVKSREELAERVAEGLEFHSDLDPDSGWYVNLTDQTVELHVGPDYGVPDWPKVGDEVVAIAPLPSFERFHSMEEFADQQPEETSKKLWKALDGRRPFARFRAAVEVLGLLKEWYAFRDAWYIERAEEWLRDHDVDFVDGKIVCTGETQTWEGDEDGWEEDGEEDEGDGEGAGK